MGKRRTFRSSLGKTTKKGKFLDDDDVFKFVGVFFLILLKSCVAAS